MHEAHGTGCTDLTVPEDPFCFSPVNIEEDDRHQFAYRIAENKAEHDRDHETVDDLDPFVTVHAGKAAVHRNRRTGQACDQRMAFAGRYSEIPREHSPYHNRKQGC